jgi:hypothetical protein
MNKDIELIGEAYTKIIEQQLQILPAGGPPKPGETVQQSAVRMAQNMFSGALIDQQLNKFGFSAQEINKFWELVSKKNVPMQQAFDQVKAEKAKQIVPTTSVQPK